MRWPARVVTGIGMVLLSAGQGLTPAWPGTPPSSRAADTRLFFDIPSQQLEAALDSYARITGHPAVFPSDLLVGRISAPLHGVYTAETALQILNNAPLAIVDEDHSQLSQRIVSAFYPPAFTPPIMIDQSQVDPGMDAGEYTFAMIIPPNFQRDVLAGRPAEIQLNTDATRMTQAFVGSGYIQQITMGEIAEFVQRHRGTDAPAVYLALRARFNPALEKSWFGGLTQIIDQITMLSIILAGAALIREREHGTIEHLLVMPVTPAQIMLAKIWSMGLVVLAASALSLNLVVRWALGAGGAGGRLAVAVLR